MAEGPRPCRLCEGDELLDQILAKKNSRYIEKDAAVVVRQMLKVAAECHLCGLVHQDMKPENLLFKSNKEDSPLKAIDFGLSDFIKLGKKFHDIIGSAYYVAPEILKQRSGPEPDVWSIGVITYILLCGRRPFWDKTEDGIFKEIRWLISSLLLLCTRTGKYLKLLLELFALKLAIRIIYWVLELTFLSSWRFASVRLN